MYTPLLVCQMAPKVSVKLSRSLVNPELPHQRMHCSACAPKDGSLLALHALFLLPELHTYFGG